MEPERSAAAHTSRLGTSRWFCPAELLCWADEWSPDSRRPGRCSLQVNMSSVSTHVTDTRGGTLPLSQFSRKTSVPPLFCSPSARE